MIKTIKTLIGQWSGLDRTRGQTYGPYQTKNYQIDIVSSFVGIILLTYQKID